MKTFRQHGRAIADLSRAPRTIEVAVTVVRTAGDKAILVNDGTRNVCLPLSQIVFEGYEAGELPLDGVTCTIHMPEWLAKNERLI